MTQEYKNWIESVFDRAANSYGEAGGSFFNEIGRELVRFANVDNSHTVLDVATGKGAVLRPIAEKFHGQDNIYGIDLSLEMINASKSSVVEKFTNIQLQQMDAENLTFPENYFDTIFCAFALFFFPHPDKALQEFKRTLKKQGMLYLSLWDGDSLIDSILQQAVQKLGVPKRIIANELHADSEELHQLLNNAGFSHLRFKKFSFVHTYANPEQWWNSLWSHAYRGYLEKLDNHQLLQLKNETFTEIKNYLNEKGQLIEEMPVVFIEATCNKM